MVIAEDIEELNQLRKLDELRLANLTLRSMLERVRQMVYNQEGDKWTEMLYAIDAILDRYMIEEERSAERSEK